VQIILNCVFFFINASFDLSFSSLFLRCCNVDVLYIRDGTHYLRALFVCLVNTQLQLLPLTSRSLPTMASSAEATFQKRAFFASCWSIRSANRCDYWLCRVFENLLLCKFTKCFPAWWLSSAIIYVFHAVSLCFHAYEVVLGLQQTGQLSPQTCATHATGT